MTDSDEKTAITAADEEASAPPPSREPEDDDEGIAWGRVIVVAVVGIALLTAGIWAWIVFVGQLNSPETAVKKMMDAYANYDAIGVLQYTTHYSITKSAEASFIEQSKKAKERAGGKPLVRDVVIDSVELRGENEALARVTAEWLIDPDKGTYRRQTTPVPLVKKDGTWIVQMF